MHPFLLLVCFNAFSTSVPPWLGIATSVWGTILTYMGPLFIALEGLSSLVVVQKLGQQGKKLVEEGEIYQFGLLIASAGTYVASAWWIVNVRRSLCVGSWSDYLQAYPAAASSPLSSTFLGVAITALLFLTFIGFFLRRTNIIESSGLALFMAYNVWLCGFDQELSSDPSYS